MDEDTAQINDFRNELRRSEQRYDLHLSEDALQRLCAYYELLLAWNSRLHLVAPCSPSEFATRHVLESLLVRQHLRANASVADIGSGAGLPIIPNLIVRPDISVTLIEASLKKTVFLREALRATVTTAQATVVAERFENLATLAVDYLTCRALDRFTEMLPSMIRWSASESTLLLFGGDSLRTPIERAGLECSPVNVPDSERRYLFVCHRRPHEGAAEDC